MLTFYRAHWIVILIDEFLNPEITERTASFPFPMKVSAMWEEGERVLLERARAIVDLSLSRFGDQAARPQRSPFRSIDPLHGEPPMPKFYFDVFDGEQTLADQEHTVLADHDAAREEATKALTEMANDYIPGDGLHRDMVIYVRDETGSKIMDVSLNFNVKPNTDRL